MAKLLTTVQAAELTGYHRDYIRRLVKDRKIKGERVGRDWLVDERSLLKHLEAATSQGAKRGPKAKA